MAAHRRVPCAGNGRRRAYAWLWRATSDTRLIATVGADGSVDYAEPSGADQVRFTFAMPSGVAGARVYFGSAAHERVRLHRYARPGVRLSARERPSDAWTRGTYCVGYHYSVLSATP